MFRDKSKEDIEAKVKEEDLRIAGFVAQHNLHFKLMEHFLDL